MDCCGDSLAFADSIGHGLRLSCERLLLCDKEFRDCGRGGARNGCRFPRARIWLARDGSLGLRDSSIWANSALQHFLEQHGVARRRSQVRSGAIRHGLESCCESWSISEMRLWLVRNDRIRKRDLQVL